MIFMIAASVVFHVSEKHHYWKGNNNRKQSNWAEFLPAGLNDPKKHKSWILTMRNKREMQNKNVKERKTPFINGLN
jgi:hypothetical protein